jgi:hypothetical protein
LPCFERCSKKVWVSLKLIRVPPRGRGKGDLTGRGLGQPAPMTVKQGVETNATAEEATFEGQTGQA